MAAFQLNNQSGFLNTDSHLPIEREMFKVAIKPINKADCYHVEYVNGNAFLANEMFSEIQLKHRTYYAVCVINYSDKSGLAEISIDGKIIGNIFCPAHDITIVERPVEINRSFVFISKDSVMSAQCGLDINSPMTGNIHVIIRPQDPKFSSITHNPIMFASTRVIENDFGTPGGACLGNGFGFAAAAAAAPSAPAAAAASAPADSGEHQQYNNRKVTLCSPESSTFTNTTQSKSAGMTVTRDTVDGDNNNNNTKFGCANKLFTVNRSTGKSFGGTVLGESTRQSFSPSPILRTLGEHHFIINLVVGDPGKNLNSLFMDE